MTLECKDGVVYYDIDFIRLSHDGLQVVLHFSMLADDYYFYRNDNDPIRVQTDNIQVIY